MVLPSKGKNKSMQRAIQCIITEILNEIKTPHLLEVNGPLLRTSADLEGVEKIRQKDIEKVLLCRDLDKSNSEMVVIK